MKQVLAMIVLAAIGCNTAPDKEALNMAGVYSMVSQSVKGGTYDTTITSMKQLKIFTADFMMYANVQPADSVSGFGVGTYSISMDTITENVFFSASDSSSSDAAASFPLVITKTEKGYTQVIPEMGTEKYKLTEVYTTVGTAATSPMDGLWKGVKMYEIKGTDTVTNEINQYKMYSAGHFMFGHTWADSTKKLHTGMGYGTFTMDGTTKIKEHIDASTYSQIRGLDVDLAIEMTGTDEYKQTITAKDGTKSVEFYKRVKK